MARNETQNPPLEERNDVMIAALRRERDGIMRWPTPDRERITEIDKALKDRGYAGKLEQPRSPQPGSGLRTATR